MPKIVEWLGLTMVVMSGIMVVKLIILSTPLGRLPGLPNAVGTV